MVGRIQSSAMRRQQQGMGMLTRAYNRQRSNSKKLKLQQPASSAKLSQPHALQSCTVLLQHATWRRTFICNEQLSVPHKGWWRRSMQAVPPVCQASMHECKHATTAAAAAAAAAHQVILPPPHGLIPGHGSTR
jgi:hypothetical protein